MSAIKDKVIDEQNELPRVKVAGYYKGDMYQRDFARTSSLRSTFNGHKLERLDVSVSMRNTQDVNNMIAFLENARGCFYREYYEAGIAERREKRIEEK